MTPKTIRGHQDTTKIQGNTESLTGNIIWGSIKLLEIERFEHVGKDGGWKNLKLRLIDS